MTRKSISPLRHWEVIYPSAGFYSLGHSPKTIFTNV